MVIWRISPGVVLECDPSVEDAGLVVDAADTGEGDLAPGTGGLGEEFGDELRGPAAEGEESDAEAVELREVGIGGEAAVEDQLAREGFRAGAPCLGEAENLVVLVLLANIGVGVGEEPGAGDAGQEGADAALPSAAPGNVVLLDQGIVAVTGNGVAVEVEGFACAEIDAEAADGGVPAVHQFRPEAGVGAGGVFAQGCPLGDCVQAGKESRPLLEGLGHHLGRPADPPELESEQGAEGAAGRDHVAAGPAGLLEDAVRIAACQVRSEEEQASEAGAQAPGSEIEGVAVRGRRPLGPASSRCSGVRRQSLGSPASRSMRFTALALAGVPSRARMAPMSSTDRLRSFRRATARCRRSAGPGRLSADLGPGACAGSVGRAPQSCRGLRKPGHRQGRVRFPGQSLRETGHIWHHGRCCPIQPDYMIHSSGNGTSAIVPSRYRAWTSQIGALGLRG